MSRTHAGREVNCGSTLGELLIKGLGGFGGVKDEKAAGGGVFSDVFDEGFVVLRTKVFASDALKGVSECLGIAYDFCYFLLGDANFELITIVKSRLSGGAEDGGGAKVFYQTGEAAENGGEEVGRESLRFIKNDHAACGAM